MSLGRNDPCSCGSGKKYKQCCLGKAAIGRASASTPAPVRTGLLGGAAVVNIRVPDQSTMSRLDQLEDGGEWHELERTAQSMILQYPECGELWKILAKAAQRRGAVSLALFQKAASLLPLDAEVLENLATCMLLQNQVKSAVPLYQRALELDPQCAAAAQNLGVAFASLGDVDRAIESLRRASEILPHSDSVHANLGTALLDAGQTDAAVASFKRAHQVAPDNLIHAINAALALPNLPVDLDAIAHWREQFRQGINAIMSENGELKTSDIYINLSWFYLAYHNQCNVELLQDLSRMFRHKIPSLTFDAPSMRSSNSVMPTASPRLRVGFLSEFFSSHTIGKLYKGLIEQLDRKNFEVIVVHAPDVHQDSYCRSINQVADKAIFLPRGIAEQQRIVASERLDVLFYPDIGMTAPSYFLAYARLAPVQVVSWGHPDTTGLDTIDYFLSADSIEPEQAQQYYSERLVRLTRLPCYYYLHSVAGLTAARKTFNLPRKGALYGCPQTLFKFHPDFDEILASIVANDPTGHIVLIEGSKPGLVTQLRKRWEKKCPQLLEKAIFLRRQDEDKFLQLLQILDVLLDPIYFGSGNTLYEAIAVGTPVVTWPGQFARGRIVAAAYHQMGISNAPIAGGADEYVQMAIDCARNTMRRDLFRQQCRERSGALFEDRQAVREIEQFLMASTTAARSGTRLQDDWQPRSPTC